MLSQVLEKSSKTKYLNRETGAQTKQAVPNIEPVALKGLNKKKTIGTSKSQ